jgi:(p)ppGpp synthase/HD superfamily hydrolase
MLGYSDRINHALAFAAKHHDRQVRKGTRLPYLTQPANVAIILTRYGCDEDTVIAGILHDVIEDCVREGWTREMLSDRIEEKFGAAVLEAVLAVTYRTRGDDGSEFDADEKRADYLHRLVEADTRARWLCAADMVHNGNSILADLKRTTELDSVWRRFSTGREGTIGWYRAVHDRLRGLGFDAPILDELQGVAKELEEYLSGNKPQTDPG